MAPIQGQNNVVQGTGSGETNATQTVVVVQQQVAATGQVAGDQGNRFPRWSYLIFGLGMASYHFVYMWFFISLALFIPTEAGGYGTLFFFCGAVPSIIGFIWMVNDSTVLCANPGTGAVKKRGCGAGRAGGGGARP
eukprot:542742_1